MAIAAILGIVLVLGPAVVTRLINDQETFPSAQAHTRAPSTNPYAQRLGLRNDAAQDHQSMD